MHQTVYEVRVRGSVSPRWARCFDHMAVLSDGRSEEETVTVLTASVPDQAALLGLLHTLYSLGLPLISVNCLECGSKNGRQTGL